MRWLRALALCVALTWPGLAFADGFTWDSGYKGDVPDAVDINTDTSSFNNSLSSTDTTVQTALDTLDNLTIAGDAVTVNSTAADSTANFLDNLYLDWALADGGAGGPDDVTAKFNYPALSGNHALLLNEAIFGQNGLIFEGATADDIELYFSVPDPATSDKTITFQNATHTLVGRDTTDTLTNKTLTAPVIASIVNTGTLTLPTATDTLVARATTDTLTNKTLAAADNVIAADTAVALAADGGNCTAGNYPLGVDASGAAQDCTAVSTFTGGAVTSAITMTAANPSYTLLTSGGLEQGLHGDATSFWLGDVNGVKAFKAGNGDIVIGDGSQTWIRLKATNLELPNASIPTQALADNAVTAAKLAPGATRTTLVSFDRTNAAGSGFVNVNVGFPGQGMVVFCEDGGAQVVGSWGLVDQSGTQMTIFERNDGTFTRNTDRMGVAQFTAGSQEIYPIFSRWDGNGFRVEWVVLGTTNGLNCSGLVYGP